MKITINGKIKEINDGENLEKLVYSLVETNEGIIAELNEQIIEKKRWTEQTLKEGDVIELIRFVGGG